MTKGKRPIYSTQARAHKYEQKPVWVYAVQLTPEFIADRNAWPSWFKVAWRKKLVQPVKLKFTSNFMIVNTERGVMKARKRDWLINGPNNELVLVAEEVFQDNYKKLDI